MINSVRNTVLSILNKNNYGYISPSDFNLFAKQAQLDIFEDYFYQYNYNINKENARASGTGYANITKGYEESINIFSESNFLVHDSINKFFTPSPSTTNDNYYLLNRVDIYTNLRANGFTNGAGANELIDTLTDFIASGVKAGDIVLNLTDNTSSEVVSVATNVLTIDDDIFVLGDEFSVYSGSDISEAERVSQSKISLLNSSLLTAPSNTFPVYTQEEPYLYMFPKTINSYGAVKCQYIRYPKDPKWTYVALSGGEPSFNASSPDYQDFEIPISDEPTLVLKILQYAGMSIREVAATQFGQSLENLETQKER